MPKSFLDFIKGGRALSSPARNHHIFRIFLIVLCGELEGHKLYKGSTVAPGAGAALPTSTAGAAPLGASTAPAIPLDTTPSFEDPGFGTFKFFFNKVSPPKSNFLIFDSARGFKGFSDDIISFLECFNGLAYFADIFNDLDTEASTMEMERMKGKAFQSSKKLAVLLRNACEFHLYNLGTLAKNRSHFRIVKDFDYVMSVLYFICFYEGGELSPLEKRLFFFYGDAFEVLKFFWRKPGFAAGSRSAYRVLFFHILAFAFQTNLNDFDFTFFNDVNLHKNLQLLSKFFHEVIVKDIPYCLEVGLVDLFKVLDLEQVDPRDRNFPSLKRALIFYDFSNGFDNQGLYRKFFSPADVQQMSQAMHD
jgi:hypothetical protein